MAGRLPRRLIIINSFSRLRILVPVNTSLKNPPKPQCLANGDRLLMLINTQKEILYYLLAKQYFLPALLTFLKLPLFF